MNNLLKTYKFSNFRVVKGNGCYLYTSDKRKLLDFSAGVAVNSLGYNHSVIKNSLKAQLKTGITHLSGSQIHAFKTKLSKLLSDNSNKGDVFFSNSGAESIEAALKIARNYGSKKGKDEMYLMDDTELQVSLIKFGIKETKFKTAFGTSFQNEKFTDLLIRISELIELFRKIPDRYDQGVLEQIAIAGCLNMEKFTKKPFSGEILKKILEFIRYSRILKINVKKK